MIHKNAARVLAVGLGLCTLGAARAADYTIHSFKKTQVTDRFWGEGADFGDFNHDGKMDVVSGPYWYEGPDFTKRHEYRAAVASFKTKKADGSEVTIEGYEGALGKNNAYSDNFLTYVYDFNGDGWADILVIGFPGAASTWFENPKGKEGNWQPHVAFDVVDNESPGFADVDGCGRPEIICNSGGYVGYAKPDWSNPSKPWTFHRISAKGGWQRFTHGIGIGDVNGDGKMDFLLAEGWWEQPASLDGDPEWKFHPFHFANGGSQMYAYDVNGDGLPDVITADEAHGYGVFWWEQVRKDGEISFVKHVLIGKTPEDSKYGVKFSQPHAIALFDVDGDGLLDLVIGKRFWAHGPNGDPEPNAPAVLYWFKLVRDPKTKQAEYVPYLIDDNSGVGTQVVAGHISGNKKLGDVVVGNKKGTYVFIQEAKKVSKAEWEKAQPKPVDVK